MLGKCKKCGSVSFGMNHICNPCFDKLKECACAGCLSADGRPEMHTCEDGMMREMLEYLRMPVETALKSAPVVHEVGIPDGNVMVEWYTSYDTLRKLLKLLDG
jgi:hypothetical protein